MDMSAEQYDAYVKRMSPDSTLGKDVLHAFLVGRGAASR